MIFTLFEKLIKYKFLIILCLVGCIVYSYFLTNRASVDLYIHTEKRTIFQVFWSQKPGDFSEKRSLKVIITPKKEHYRFVLTNLRKVNFLRIDPHQYAGKIIIEKIRFVQRGLKPIQMSPREGFVSFVGENQITSYQVEESGLVVESSGRDPFLVFNLQVEKTPFPWFLELLRYSFICLIIIAVYFTSKHLKDNLGYVPIFMACAVTLVTIMAFNSDENVHPDEHVHVQASRYYQENWLPPLFDDPAIQHTYSPYGASRLNNSEIYYFFAGKFGEILKNLKLEPFLMFRLFNVLLFALLLLYTLRVTGARYVALPFLISPQIWYVFSYCNSDGFAMFITFLVGVQVVDPASMFNVFLKQKRNKYTIFRAVVLGILLGCLLLLKMNFYPFIAFLLIVIGWQIWEIDSKEERVLVVKRLLIITMIGCALFGLRRGADYYVNGLDKTAKLYAIRVKLAEPIFNPATELPKKHIHLSMKQKGVPLEYIINTKRFFEKSFRTAFGAYGYFTAQAAYRYYDIVRWTGVALLLLFLGHIFISSWRQNGIITCSLIFFSLLLIWFSLDHAWTRDFQAQGRYLFPIASMIGIVCGRNYKIFSRGSLISLFVVMFCLSAYSYIFVAISKIPK